MSAAALRPAVVLSIAGSDPSGGAGLQADLKTFAALRVYGAAAVTAITVQDSRGVSAFRPVPAGLVAAQVRAVLGDMPVAAVKTGMLATVATIESLAEVMSEHPGPLLVVDPVLAASDGTPLLEPGGVDLYRLLLPRATVVTPNQQEAQVLAGRTDLQPADLARAICDLGAAAVLLKGGHTSSVAAAGGDVVDLLARGLEVREIRHRRLKTAAGHGTGCALAAALAAFCAVGMALPEAALAAVVYVHRALEAAPPLGRGRGPLHHLHPLWS